MVNGPHIQLVSTGAENSVLSGNPSTTFFKYNSKQYNNFSSSVIEQIVEGTIGFGNRVEINISRSGDLLNEVFLVIKLPKLLNKNAKWIDNIGYFLLEMVELNIGGNTIERYTGEWLYLKSRLKNKLSCLDIADVNKNFVNNDNNEIIIPLEFIFNQAHNSLPLISLLPNCEVKVLIDIARIEKLIYGIDSCNASYAIPADGMGNSRASENFKAYAGYYYLDEEQRNLFTQKRVLDYLVETVEMNLNNSLHIENEEQSIDEGCFVRNFKGTTQMNSTMKVSENGNMLSLNLDFTGMSKFMLWTVNTWAVDKDNKIQTSRLPWYLPAKGAYMRFNNQDRLPLMPWIYYSQYTKNKTNCEDDAFDNKSFSALYPFTLDVEDYSDPSGSCNFGRLSHKSLEIESGNLSEFAKYAWDVNSNESYEFDKHSNEFNVNIYSHRYNVLRISNGQAALAFD